MKSDFVHLHVHSDGSLLDGAAKIDDLVDRAAALGMPALALTDHGNLFGAVDFYRKAKARGIKPIVGYEAYVAPGSRKDKSAANPKTASHHLTLLVRDLEGYRNLLKLASTAYLDGFYYRPRIDKEVLAKHHRGLIALSGCLKSEMNSCFVAGRESEAERIAGEYRDLFGPENFFMEVMSNSVPEQRIANEGVRRVAKRLGQPLVATNDVHYVAREDALAQEVLICIHTGKTFSDADRLKFTSDDFYFKTPDEMMQAFSAMGMPEAVTNTLRVADACNLELDFRGYHLPQFKPDGGEDPVAYFRRLCLEGCRARYPEYGDAVRQRLEQEMAVIESMGFASYFLIVWDFIRYARENGIPVGPGRGSAAGSLVAFSLGITNVDPLRYDLLFERFLNAERISLPDIDIDFCKEGRERVIQYVTAKYGAENVAQIITFGTMAARAVIRDVGRVLGIPLPDVDGLAKKIPSGPKISLKESLEGDLELRRAYETDASVRRLFDISLKLEGLSRHASTHAAGVVITDVALENYVPLFKNGDDVTTQFTMTVLEDIGLLKMDFLGLNTLTILDRALRLIEETRGTKLDLAGIPLDDVATYELLQRGEAFGVFQLESGGMRDLLQKMRPDCFEDLIAILALYRPGPLGSGMVETFVRCKHGEEEIRYKHPLLEPILRETNGVILYQEQVMRIANRLAGFSLNEADSLRKAMGKKKPEIMAKFKEKFIGGAVANGVEESTAKELFGLIEFFGGYGFNKSHSTAYALISYQTAYLKANYPVEFLAAVLSCEIDNTDKVVEYVNECRRLAIPILGPHVNHSRQDFSVESGGIRVGLLAVKGIGEKAVEAILRARDAGGAFRTVFDLCERADVRAANRTALEILAKAGALDGLGAHRAALLAEVDGAVTSGARAQEDRRAGQGSLFGGGAAVAAAVAAAPPPSAAAAPWNDREILLAEKETLGFYLSSHPLLKHEEVLKRFSSAKTTELANRKDGDEVLIGGMVKSLRSTVTRAGRNKGERMALLRIEDLEGSVGAVVFATEFAKYSELVVEDAIAFFKGRLDLSREEPSIKVSEIVGMDRALASLCRFLSLRIDEDRASDDKLQTLRSLLERHPGSCPVILELVSSSGEKTQIRTASRFSVTPSDRIVSDLAGVVGEGAVSFG
jgi:DNA polymerase III subunit alpha